MNRATLILFVTVTACFGQVRVNSQAPSSSGPTLTALLGLKAANQELVLRQEKTLKTLEELREAASQVKAMGKRS